ncbi:hypothetical protein [Streptomyces sp. 184]|uniref:hypothetical protein n=1 Tax=Streptomyces sp. 184 TaxID=1827526 RepID=UPI003891D07B
MIAFLCGLVARYPLTGARVVDANGAPALSVSVDGAGQVVSLDVHDGRIHGIFAVLNPNKLGRMQAKSGNGA